MPRRPCTRTDRIIGLRIRERRQALGIRQDVLAAALNVSQQQLHKYESGSNKIAASRLVDIAYHLNIEAGYFLNGIE